MLGLEFGKRVLVRTKLSVRFRIRNKIRVRIRIRIRVRVGVWGMGYGVWGKVQGFSWFGTGLLPLPILIYIAHPQRYYWKLPSMWLRRSSFPCILVWLAEEERPVLVLVRESSTLLLYTTIPRRYVVLTRPF